MLLEIREGRLAVAEVAPGSAAAEAGVLPLDLLLEVDGRSLVDLDPIEPEEILALFRRQEPDGHRIVLGRGGGTLTIVLKEGAGRPAAAPGAAGPPAASAGPPRPGTPAPPFVAQDHAGREITLESLRGRLVLIDFWASWCAPCRAAELTVRRLAQEHESLLVVVGISLDTDRKAFEAFVYNHHLPGHQVFEGGRPGPIGRRYGVTETGIPFAVLVDARGRVAATGGSFQTIEAALRAAAPAESPARD
jgi:thiol-disulfide isomerase/thioredoxin